MKIKIVNYSKKYEKSIDKLLKEQWNGTFCHDKKIIGKVSLLDNNFAGTCYGLIEKDYIYQQFVFVKNIENAELGQNF